MYGYVSVAQQDLCTVTIEGTIVSFENRVATGKEVTRSQEEREKNSVRYDRWNKNYHDPAMCPFLKSEGSAGQEFISL